MQYLEFEKPLADIEGKAEELRAMAKTGGGVDMSKEAEALDRKAQDLLKNLYGNLSAWRKCQVARHPDRPNCKDYIEELFSEYTPLAGDRTYGDDHAVMGGLARFRDTPGRRSSDWRDCWATRRATPSASSALMAYWWTIFSG